MEQSKMKNEMLPMKKRKLRYVEECSSSSQPEPESSQSIRKSSGASKPKYPRLSRSSVCPDEAPSHETTDKVEDYPKAGEFEVVISREERINAQNIYCHALLKELCPEGHDYEVADHFLVEKIELPDHLQFPSKAVADDSAAKSAELQVK